MELSRAQVIQMKGGREERKRAHSDVRPLSTAVPNESDGPHQRGDISGPCGC